MLVKKLLFIMNELIINTINRTFSYICNDCDRYTNRSYHEYRDRDDILRIIIDGNWGEELMFTKSRLDLLKIIR